MSGREERVARNEATAREINEGIEDAHAGDGPAFFRIVCECGNAACEDLIAVTVPEYEHIREDPRRFAVRPGHVAEDIEELVLETDRYVVVVKKAGTAADIAEETDPRS